MLPSLCADKEDTDLQSAPLFPPLPAGRAQRGGRSEFCRKGKKTVDRNHSVWYTIKVEKSSRHLGH